MAPAEESRTVDPVRASALIASSASRRYSLDAVAQAMVDSPYHRQAYRDQQKSLETAQRQLELLDACASSARAGHALDFGGDELTWVARACLWGVRALGIDAGFLDEATGETQILHPHAPITRIMELARGKLDRLPADLVGDEETMPLAYMRWMLSEVPNLPEDQRAGVVELLEDAYSEQVQAVRWEQQRLFEVEEERWEVGSAHLHSKTKEIRAVHHCREIIQRRLLRKFRKLQSLAKATPRPATACRKRSKPRATRVAVAAAAPPTLVTADD